MSSVPTSGPANDVEGPYGAGAGELHAAGWHPIPVRGKDQPPRGYTGSSGEYPSRADIQAWLDGPEARYNVAVRLSDTVLGIDVDAYDSKVGERTLDACVHRWGLLPATWCTTSRDDQVSGIRFYRIPADADLSRAESQVRMIGPHIDIIHKGHRYAMVPPSGHPATGRPYQWHTPDGDVAVQPPKVDELPFLPDEWLQALTAGPAPTLPLSPQAASTATALQHDWDIGDPAVLDDWKQPIRAGDRHKTLTSRLGWMRSIGVPLQVAEAAARGFHTQCEQSAGGPFTQSEALRIANDLYDRYPAGQLSGQVDVPEPESAPTPEDGRPQFTPFNGAWLDQQTFWPLRYHVDRIVPEGFTLLIGAPKIGKSWLALSIALEVARGGIVLGQLTEARPVLLMALEDGHRRLQDRARQLLQGAPIPAGLDYATQVPPEQVLPSIAVWLEKHGPAAPLVIVDTLGKVMPPAAFGENSYQRDYRIGARLKALCDKYPGTALVSPHHDRKADAEDFVDRVSGTHGLAGSADTVIVLDRRRNQETGILHVAGRDVFEGEYALRFKDGLWTLYGDSLAEAARRADLDRATAGLADRSAEVVSVVNSHPEGLTVDHVARACGMDRKTTGTYLGRLAAQKRIDRYGRGVYGPTVDLHLEPDTADPPTGDGEDGNGHSPDGALW